MSVRFCVNMDGLASLRADGALGEQALEREGLGCLGMVGFGGPALSRQLAVSPTAHLRDALHAQCAIPSSQHNYTLQL